MNTGNLPLQAFSAVVTPEQGYKVTVNFGAGFDLTNAVVRVYQRSKQLTAGAPNLAVSGQQIVITYSVEQLTELRKAASVTQHHIYLPNMPYTTRVGWEITVVNKFSDSVQVESLLGVTLGEDGETIAVSILGADVVAGLVAQAEGFKDGAEDAKIAAQGILEEVEGLLYGTGPPYTINQVRAFSGQVENIFRISDSPSAPIAVYDSLSNSSDNGTTIIVDADGRRYRLTTIMGLFNQITKAINIWDIA